MLTWIVQSALAAPIALEPRQLLDDLGPGPISAVAHGGPPDARGLGPRGGVLRKTLHRDGIPIEGAAVARVDADGQLVSLQVPEHLERWATGTPLPAAQAIDLAETLFGGHGHRARIEWQPVGDTMRPVWEVRTQPGGGAWVAPTTRIDALSGRVLGVSEGAEAMVPMGLAYINNPVVDDAPIVVELPLAIEALSDDRMVILQCRDRGEVGSSGLRVCTEEPAAGPDADGNYLSEPVLDAADPATDEDEFAAVHAYWNTHRGFDWFEALGWEPAEGFDAYTEVVVNYRGVDRSTEVSATSPDAALDPQDTAYFTGMYQDWNGEWVNARMVFGQGTYVDKAYDADTIMHELGHLIYRSQAGPYESRESTFGPSHEASALNEGLADYWSTAIQGDPLMAEYSATGSDQPATRVLDGDLSCATDVAGLAHSDGLIFAQALWTVRQTFDPSTAMAFDRTLLDSISMFGLAINFSFAATVMVAEVETAVSVEAAATLQAEFDRRQLFACDPVVPVTPGPEPFRDFIFISPGEPYYTLGPMPAPVQFVVEVPEEGADYTFRFDQTQWEGYNHFADDRYDRFPLELVGRKRQPLTWETDYVEVEVDWYGELLDFYVADWTHDGDWIAEAMEVSYEPPPEGEFSAEISYEAQFSLKGGTWYLQLINPHVNGATPQNLVLDVLPPPVEPDPAADPTPLAPQSSRLAAESVAGCGCAVGTRVGGAWTLAAVLWGLRRRSPRRPLTEL